MSKADLNASSGYYPSSNAYPDTSDHQNGNTSDRNEVPEKAITQQSKETEKSSSYVTTSGGIKIPKLQTKPITQDSGSLSQFSPSRASNSSKDSTGTGAPGPKPEILIGMPGSPLPKTPSPRQKQDTSDQPISPRQQQTQSSDNSMPTSPRKLLGQGPVPKSFRSPRNEKNDAAQKTSGSLSPREGTRGIPAVIINSDGKTPAKTTESAHDIDLDDLRRLMDEDLMTKTKSDEPKTELPADGSMKIMRIRARVSSRMLGEAPPVSPRSAQWARVKPTTSDRMMVSDKASTASRSNAISTTVQLYSKATLDLLKQGKPESIKSLARIDPQIAATDMPASLKPFYASNSLTDFPVAPLLRQLYKNELEGTQQWKNAEQLTKDAIKQCDRSIPFGVTTGTRKDNETAKLKPLAETVIDALFPANASSNGTDANQPIRRLSDSFLTNDFIKNVLLVVDQAVIEKCQADDSLRMNDINSIRYAVLFDLIFTRMVLPMLIRLFPEIPNQSQVWMQSALRDCLKNTMVHIAADFFDQSLKVMPDKHRNFINQKAKQEEELLRKEKEELLGRRIFEIKMKSNSSRNMSYYNAIADQKKRREYTKNNKALYDQVLDKLNTDFLDDAAAELIGREISKKLKNYDQPQSVDQIRQDLLSIFNALPKDKLSTPLKALIQLLHLQVGEDTNNRVRRRTVAFDANLVQQWYPEFGENGSSFGDETVIHQAVLETFNADEMAPVVTTTTNSTTPTTTTTTTTTTTATTTVAPSLALSAVAMADTHQGADPTSAHKTSDDSPEKTV